MSFSLLVMAVAFGLSALDGLHLARALHMTVTAGDAQSALVAAAHRRIASVRLGLSVTLLAVAALAERGTLPWPWLAAALVVWNLVHVCLPRIGHLRARFTLLDEHERAA